MNKLYGKVIGNAKRQEGTLKVCVETRKRHIKYPVYITKKRNFLVHLDTGAYSDAQLSDENFLLNANVVLLPCRPVSKLKRHTVEVI